MAQITQLSIYRCRHQICEMGFVAVSASYHDASNCYQEVLRSVMFVGRFVGSLISDQRLH